MGSLSMLSVRWGEDTPLLRVGEGEVKTSGCTNPDW